MNNSEIIRVNDKWHKLRGLILGKLSGLVVSGKITAKQYQKRVHTLNLGTLRRVRDLN